MSRGSGSWEAGFLSDTGTTSTPNPAASPEAAGCFLCAALITAFDLSARAYEQDRFNYYVPGTFERYEASDANHDLGPTLL